MKKPGTKIELSTQTQSDSGVRKSNCYVRNTFTQSVKNTYVDQESNIYRVLRCRGCISGLMRMIGRCWKTVTGVAGRSRNIDCAATDTGVRTGSVRNPVGYALQLLKAAREGRYHPFPAETGMKSASLQKMSGTPDVSQHTQTKTGENGEK